LLPPRFFQGDPLPNTRDLALKEISRHITSDNISQWNRTIGRLLDTGLSELGLHFCLERSSTLSKFLSDHGNLSRDEIEDEVNAFVQNLSTILWKLRYEHFHFFILCLSSLPHTASSPAPVSSSSITTSIITTSSSSSSHHLHVNSSLYPMEQLHLLPEVIQMILKKFSQTSIPDSTKNDSTEMKKKLVSKPKTIIKKLGAAAATEGGGESENSALELMTAPPIGKSGSSSSGGGPSAQLLESVLDFYTLFLLLPSGLHPTLRKSFYHLPALKELCVQLLTSLEYSEKFLSERLFTLLSHHSSARLGQPLPVNEILTNSLHLLILHTNSTPHKDAFKKQNWEIIFQKFFIFQKDFHSKFWIDMTTSLLHLDPTLLEKPIQECRDLYANRYEAYQGLMELLSLYSISLPVASITIELFFQTHIFLFSNEILKMTNFTLQSSSSSSTSSCSSVLSLPLSLNSFSSPDLLHQLFNQIQSHLEQRLRCSSPTMMHRNENVSVSFGDGHEKEEAGEEGKEGMTPRMMVMMLTHLLRIWKWGSQLIRREQKIQSLFEFWASHGVTTTTEDGNDDAVAAQLACYVTILELCSQHHLHEEFFDVLLLDVLTPSLVKHNSLSLLQPHIGIILQLSQGFGEEYSAWVRILSSPLPPSFCLSI
jgi:hypothetical protein